MNNSQCLLDLTISNFAKLFGTTEEKIISYCGDIITAFDFRYRLIGGDERDQIILKILKHIDSDEVAKAGRERQPDWEKGWGENLQEFIDSGYDLDKLVPKYFKKNVPVRLNRNYIMPVSEDLVLNATNVFRNWLFQEYFKNIDSIYEFGCGSATHLAFLASLYPGKKLYGFDWAKSSQEIISLLAQHYGWSVQSGYFDFFHPNEDIELEFNSAIFTFGSLEQVGNMYEPFLNFLLKKSPEMCINVEGLCELYEDNYLLDYLARKYHKRRNYLNGYLTRLRELEKEGSIEIIKVHHQLFGNIFDDPHSYVVWKPKK